MNTPEVVKTVAERLDLTQKDSREMLKKTVQVLKMLLRKKESFTIPDLGTFSTHVRERRKSFIPYYKKVMMLPPKRVVHFQPSTDLKEEVKDIEVDDER